MDRGAWSAVVPGLAKSQTHLSTYTYVCVCVCVCVRVYIYIYIYIMFSSLWGESKLAKMACSGSVTQHFANDDYVTAEITCSTAHACHKVYVIAEIMYSAVHGCHELLAWSQVVCNMCM